ncbi:josephin-2-like [Ammospiza maritima maritima]
MAALGMLGLAAVWWDKRRPLERLCVPRVLGFLLNVPSRVTLGALALPLRRPHWLCVRPFGPAFYNLDSKLATPTRIGRSRSSGSSCARRWPRRPPSSCWW